MLLALDVGNTNIVIGFLDVSGIRNIARLETDRDKTAHEYAISLRQVIEFSGIAPEDVDGAILSSVVPPINGALVAAVRMITGIRPLVVGPGMKTGLNIALDNPATMGSDLVVGAAAALGDIAVILFEQPAEALPHQLYFCLPQHQGLHAADGLQGRVVQRQLCLLHGVRKHTGEVAVLDIPVHAEAVGRTPDRSLFGGGAGLAILNVLCQNPIQIFRVQVNSSS